MSTELELARLYGRWRAIILFKFASKCVHTIWEDKQSAEDKTLKNLVSHIRVVAAYILDKFLRANFTRRQQEANILGTEAPHADEAASGVGSLPPEGAGKVIGSDKSSRLIAEASF